MQEGTLKLDKSDNKKIISEHSKIPGHRTILEKLQSRSVKRFENIFRSTRSFNKSKACHIYGVSVINPCYFLNFHSSL